MSVWIQNLRLVLEDNPVVLLHGNVRDRYIDETGRVYENLTDLLTDVAHNLPGLSVTDLTFYDPAGGERSTQLRDQPTLPAAAGDLGGTSPVTERSSPESAGSPRPREVPQTVLARWARQLSDPRNSRFSVLFYLDKIVSYRASYNEEESQCILWLEKAVENISPNHRLVMVALQDTMVPVEIYTQSPKCRVIAIPMPDKAARQRYIRQQLGEHEHLDAMADLTDGLYLHELHHVAEGVHSRTNVGSRELGTLINRYRV
ncbi:MAG: hypothetical protein M3Y28_07100, partial [Armatimonadota bacterium]|nr:hypothetical protein [Armatimonadota bacterium]